MIGQRVFDCGRAWAHGADYFVAPATGVYPLPDAISECRPVRKLIAMRFSAISLLETPEGKEGRLDRPDALRNGAVGKIDDNSPKPAASTAESFADAKRR